MSRPPNSDCFQVFVRVRPGVHEAEKERHRRQRSSGVIDETFQTAVKQERERLFDDAVDVLDAHTVQVTREATATRPPPAAFASAIAARGRADAAAAGGGDNRRNGANRGRENGGTPRRRSLTPRGTRFGQDAAATTGHAFGDMIGPGAFGRAAAGTAAFRRTNTAQPRMRAASSHDIDYLQRPVHANYNFNRCFSSVPSHGCFADQASVFDAVGVPVLRSFSEGYNGCVMAYGQTGSGKTFTMMGPDPRGAALAVEPEGGAHSATAGSRRGEGGQLSLGGSQGGAQPPAQLLGLIPRIVNRLYTSVLPGLQARENESAGTREGAARSGSGNTRLPSTKLEIRLSYYEIYKERVYDLLAPVPVELRVRRNNTREEIEGLTWKTPATCAAALRLIASGNDSREVASTVHNVASSRSHAIVVLQLVRVPAAGWCTPEERRHFGPRNALTLVDLAGSERLGGANISADRMHEASVINGSLSVLGRVIHALSRRPALVQVEGASDAAGEVAKQQQQQQQQHVPYRESNLTWLLRDSLGGNARSVLLATVAPERYNLHESECTLKYASTARRIVNVPKRVTAALSQQEAYAFVASEMQLLRRDLDQMREERDRALVARDDATHRLHEQQLHMQGLLQTVGGGGAAQAAAAGLLFVHGVDTRRPSPQGTTTTTTASLGRHSHGSSHNQPQHHHARGAAVTAASAVQFSTPRGRSSNPATVGHQHFPTVSATTASSKPTAAVMTMTEGTPLRGMQRTPRRGGGAGNNGMTSTAVGDDDEGDALDPFFATPAGAARTARESLSRGAFDTPAPVPWQRRQRRDAAAREGGGDVLPTQHLQQQRHQHSASQERMVQPHRPRLSAGSDNQARLSGDPRAAAPSCSVDPSRRLSPSPLSSRSGPSEPRPRDNSSSDRSDRSSSADSLELLDNISIDETRAARMACGTTDVHACLEYIKQQRKATLAATKAAAVAARAKNNAMGEPQRVAPPTAAARVAPFPVAPAAAAPVVAAPSTPANPPAENGDTARRQQRVVFDQRNMPTPHVVVEMARTGGATYLGTPPPPVLGLAGAAMTVPSAGVSTGGGGGTWLAPSPSQTALFQATQPTQQPKPILRRPSPQGPPPNLQQLQQQQQPVVVAFPRASLQEPAAFVPVPRLDLSMRQARPRVGGPGGGGGFAGASGAGEVGSGHMSSARSLSPAMEAATVAAAAAAAAAAALSASLQEGDINSARGSTRGSARGAGGDADIGRMQQQQQQNQTRGRSRDVAPLPRGVRVPLQAVSGVANASAPAAALLPPGRWTGQEQQPHNGPNGAAPFRPAPHQWSHSPTGPLHKASLPEQQPLQPFAATDSWQRNATPRAPTYEHAAPMGAAATMTGRPASGARVFALPTGPPPASLFSGAATVVDDDAAREIRRAAREVERALAARFEEASQRF